MKKGEKEGRIGGWKEGMKDEKRKGEGEKRRRGEQIDTIKYVRRIHTSLTVSIRVKESHNITGDSEYFEGFFVQARRQDSSKGSVTEALGVFSDPPTDTKLLSCNSNNVSTFYSVRW